MVKQIAILLFVMISNIGIAQTKIQEGKILFDITYEDVPAQLQSKVEQLAKDAVIYFKDKKSRTEMGLGAFGKNTTIVDKDSNSIFVLLNVFGNRFALKKSTAELLQMNKGQLKILQPELKNDSRMIAGYSCKHIVLKSVLNSDTAETHCWFAPEIIPINFNNDPNFEQIEGMVLEYYIQADQLKIHLKAKEVVVQAIDPTLFKVPMNYQLVDEAELNKRMQVIMNKGQN
jgi:GLPGLI family protein